MKFKIANIITCCRIFACAVLIFLSPRSAAFLCVYLFCGLSDAADGYVARKTHTESRFGAKLDSIADFLFFAVAAAKLLPLLHLKPWLWVWIFLIAAFRIFTVLLGLLRFRRLITPHIILDKITGVLLFLTGVILPFTKITLPVILDCVAASAASVRYFIEYPKSEG